MLYSHFRKKYKEPSVNEGFKEVIETKFNPQFNDKKAEELYRMHLLEK